MKIKESMRGLLFPVVATVVLLWFFAALSDLNAGRDKQGHEQLETALRRSTVACYAAEGIYPPSIDYLEEHYGVQIDKERYTVIYEIFASNLMPDITVLDKNA